MTSRDSGGGTPAFSGGDWNSTFTPGIVDRRDQLLADLLLVVAGEDAAVDVGRGVLRQRVRRVAALDLRGDAVGAQDGVGATDPS